MDLSSFHLRSKAHVVRVSLDEIQYDNKVLHHLVDVKRLKSGDLLSLCDGRGTVQIGELVPDGHFPSKHKEGRKASNLRIQLVDDSLRVEDSRIPLEMVLCLIEPDRLDRAIAALTELGVTKITLVEARRSRSLGSALNSQRLGLERLKKITYEAAGQSRALFVPEISFEEMESVLDRVVVCSATGERLATRPSAILVGPEGGFEEDEIPKRVLTMRLPGNILRSETAAVSAAAIVMGM